MKIATMGTLWFYILMLGFGAVNFALGLFAAALLGIGPWRHCRAARFISEPALTPPAFLVAFAWRVRGRRAKS